MALAKRSMGLIGKAARNFGKMAADAVMNPVPCWADYLRQTR
jgi:hypothetical protein